MMKKNIVTSVLILLACPLWGQVGKSKTPVGEQQQSTNTSPILTYTCNQNAEMPSEFKQVTEQVLVKEASKKLEIVPPVFEMVAEQVLVSPAHSGSDILQTITEQILIKAASKTLLAIPPVYQDVTETLLLKDSYTITINIYGQTQSIVIPAKYQTITKQVLKNPAGITETIIPAEYQVITKQIFDPNHSHSTKEGTTMSKLIPAEYKQIKKQVLKMPATVKEIDVPAEYLTVKKYVMVKKGITAPIAILCEKDLSPKLIHNLYTSLQAKGYNIVTSATLTSYFWESLVQFQFEKGLPLGVLDAKTMAVLL